MGKMKDSELTEEEKLIRQKEDVLFEKMSAPPKLLEGMMDVLGQNTESQNEESLSGKKRPRKTNEKQSNSTKKMSKKDP